MTDALRTQIGAPIDIRNMPPLRDPQRALEMAIQTAIEAAQVSLRMLELSRIQLQRARQGKGNR